MTTQKPDHNPDTKFDSDAVTRFFTAIGDPIRLQILFTLKGERMNVGQLSAYFTITRPAISHHLKLLKDAHVLSSEKVGQEVYYWIDKRYLVEELRGVADHLEAMIR